MSDLKNKNIIVTGASGGIGNSIVKKLSESKANICLLYTSPSPRDKRQSRMPSSA